MKKIISFILLTLILSLAVIPAYAENTVTINSINIDSTAVTINYNTSGLSETDQVTLITYLADNAEVAPTENNIKYIDQFTKADNTSFAFSFKDAPVGTYQVKMGGTDINTPDAISITIDEAMPDKVNFMKNAIDLYTVSHLEKNDFVLSDNKGIFVMKPGNNYIAASAKAPILDGYTIKGYGIRLNSNDYSANVDLSATNTFGVLFHGATITDGLKINALPYVTYAKEGAEDITFYGTAYVDTLSFE